MIKMNWMHFKWLNCMGILVSFALVTGCASQQGLGPSMWGGQYLPDDHALALKIQRTMALDPHLKHSTIHVKCENGNVKLEGVVDSPLKAAYAETVATGVVGVGSVKNKIRIVVPRSYS